MLWTVEAEDRGQGIGRRLGKELFCGLFYQDEGLSRTAGEYRGVRFGTTSYVNLNIPASQYIATVTVI